MAHYITPDLKDPAYHLLVGKPPEIITATKSPRILLINLHGTEHLAARIFHFIQTQRTDLLEHVDYICGNPKAAAATPQKRYIESDLNRSFSPTGRPKTYEEKRAAELVDRLRSYDYVLDLHTTTTSAGSSKRFGITIDPNTSFTRKTIAASPIERIVVFPRGKEGYIGEKIPKTMAFEYNQDFARTPRAITEMIQTVDVLIGKKISTPKLREFFYITRPIPRVEDPGINTPNFELYNDSYYPVLLGDNSYRMDPTKPYVGYAATKKELVTL